MFCFFCGDKNLFQNIKKFHVKYISTTTLGAYVNYVIIAESMIAPNTKRNHVALQLIFPTAWRSCPFSPFFKFDIFWARTETPGGV